MLVCGVSKHILVKNPANSKTTDCSGGRGEYLGVKGKIMGCEKGSGATVRVSFGNTAVS